MRPRPSALRDFTVDGGLAWSIDSVLHFFNSSTTTGCSGTGFREATVLVLPTTFRQMDRVTLATFVAKSTSCTKRDELAPSQPGAGGEEDHGSFPLWKLLEQCLPFCSREKFRIAQPLRRRPDSCDRVMGRPPIANRMREDRGHDVANFGFSSRGLPDCRPSS
jgi:hypothetical protein